MEVTSITYNSNEVTKETIDSRTVYTIKPIDKYYTSDDLARINADDYLDEIRAKEVIILKNEIMENKEVQALDSEYLLSLMKQANTDKDAAFELGK